MTSDRVTSYELRIKESRQREVHLSLSTVSLSNEARVYREQSALLIIRNSHEKVYLWKVYIPESFREQDRAALIAFCKEQSFGTVITNSTSGAPTITHLPFVLKEEGDQVLIEFHLASVNHQAAVLANGTECGISVMGTHGYISSSVYHHENVPTYNYASVYLSGTSQRMTDEALLQHLSELTDRFEHGRTQPLTFDDFNTTLITEYLKEITGVRIVVTKMEGAFKLSQNRNTTDFNAVITDLEKRQENDLSSTMKNHYPNEK